MFSEWTDPYDIDNYYNDLNGAFQSYSSSPSNSMYQRLPHQMPVVPKVEIKPEEPTGVIINTPVKQKNPFEVGSDTTFLDGHPVGKQPEYNILRSGPKESFEELKCGKSYSLENWIYIIVVFVLFVLMCYQINSLKCCIYKLKKKLEKMNDRLNFPKA